MAFGGLVGCGIHCILAGGILSHASVLLPQQFTLGVAPNLLLIVLAVLAFSLSFVSRQILLLITAIALIASIALGQVYDATQLQPWHWTSLEFKEWGNATVLALVASGLGMGLYWQTTVNRSINRHQLALLYCRSGWHNWWL